MVVEEESASGPDFTAGEAMATAGGVAIGVGTTTGEDVVGVTAIALADLGGRETLTMGMSEIVIAFMIGLGETVVMILVTVCVRASDAFVCIIFVTKVCSALSVTVCMIVIGGRVGADSVMVSTIVMASESESDPDEPVSPMLDPEPDGLEAESPSTLTTRYGNACTVLRIASKEVM